MRAVWATVVSTLSGCSVTGYLPWSGPVVRSDGRCGPLCGQVAQHPADDVGGLGRWLRLDTQPFHRGEVVVDVLTFVQIEGARQLFDVDDVGQFGVREPQNRVRASGRRVAAGM